MHSFVDVATLKSEASTMCGCGKGGGGACSVGDARIIRKMRLDRHHLMVVLAVERGNPVDEKVPSE